MDSFLQWLQQLQFDSVLDTVLIVAASLLCITVHETSHGLVAYWMGDDTAKRAGRLSLNPLRHIDLVGLVMMALAGFGWAKAVPINMRKFRSPKLGMAVSAFAGPLSNVLLALAALMVEAVILVIWYSTENAALLYAIWFLDYVTALSAGLAVFNLFPIPPLDGSKVMFALLPDRWYGVILRYERFGMLLLAVLLLTNILDVPLGYIRDGLLDVMTAIASPVFDLLANLVL